MVTRITQQAQNFRRDGGWAKIDPSLVPSPREGYLARNKADEYTADLPESLATPVRFAAGGAWVSFAMVGEDAAGSFEDSTATYRLGDQARVEYVTDPGVLRERIVLSSAAAAARYRYDVRTSSGLSPELRGDGSIVFERGGRAVFEFAAPAAWDAAGKAGPARFTLSEDDEGSSTVTLRLDADWLGAADRKFPVVLDPDVSWVGDAQRFHGANLDCTIAKATPTQNLCAQTFLEVGGPTAASKEALLKFDVRSAVPADAQVSAARLGLYNQTRTGGTQNNDLRVRRLTQAWTAGATWNTADGTTAWAAGAQDPAAAGVDFTMMGPGFWYGWVPTELTQGWVNGSIPNHGMVLKVADGNNSPLYRFTSTEGDPADWPYLDVVWQPAGGNLAGYALPEIGRDSDAAMRVNPANGNLLLDTADALDATGAPVAGRVFNSVLTWHVWGSFGVGWSPSWGSFGFDDDTNDGSVRFYTDTDSVFTFIKEPGGGYHASTQDGGTLTKNPDGSFTVTTIKNALPITYRGFVEHWKERSVTRAGVTTTYGLQSGSGARAVTRDGTAVATIQVDQDGNLDEIDPVTGPTRSFSFNGDSWLSTVTESSGTTTYQYSGFRDTLTRITRPGGSNTRFTYDTNGRLATLAEHDSGASTAKRTMTMAYAAPGSACNATRDAGQTTITETPGGWTDVYCWDQSGRITDRAQRPFQGEEGNFSFVYENLPGIRNGVNVASGHLFVEDTDAEVTTDAPGFDLTRAYNSGDTRADTPLGTGWKLDATARLEHNGDGDIDVELPSGTFARFAFNEATGLYEADQYGRRTLVKAATGFIVEDSETGERFRFDADSGRLVERERAGIAGEITYGYDGSGRLLTISAPGPEVTTLNYNNAGTLTSASLPGGQSVSFGLTNGALTSRTKGTATTNYGYTSGRLTSVHSPDGKVAFQYDTSGRVAQLVNVTNLSSNTGPTTGFAYYGTTQLGSCPSGSAGRTVVTRPDGTPVTHCYNTQAFVHQTGVGATPPALSLGGSLDPLRDTKVTAGTYALSFSATDPSGVTGVDVLVDGDVIEQFGASGTWSLDTNELLEGWRTVTVRARGQDGDSISETFRLGIPAPVFGDGTIPNEPPLPADAEDDITTAECEQHYGAGSHYCLEDGGGVSLLAAPSELIYGISDDDVARDVGQASASYLATTAFSDLKVKRLRRIVPWNVVDHEDRLDAFRRFYQQARDLSPRRDIMVSFQLGCPDDAPQPNCYRDGNNFASGRETPPSMAAYIAKVRAFKKEFPLVVWMAAWNEPNHRRQPTNANNGGAGPKRAALYTYLLENNVCAPSRRTGVACNVLAGDLAQSPNKSEIGYLKTYRESLEQRIAAAPASRNLHMPAHWAIHPYTDVDKRRSDLTQTNVHRLLRTIPADDRVWFTEVGARLDLPGKSEATQVAETDYLIDRLAKWSKRIDRVYYYSLCPGNSENTGLFAQPTPPTPTASCLGAPRPAYSTYKSKTLLNPFG